MHQPVELAERRIHSEWGITNTTLASIYKLYSSYLIQQRDETAEKILRHAFSIDPFDSELYRMYSDFQMGRNNTGSAIRHLHISRVADKKDATPIRNLIQFYYKNNSVPGRLLAALKAVLPIEKDPEISQQVKNEIRRLEDSLTSKNSWVKTTAEKARKYFSDGSWLEALEEYKSLNAFNASDASFLVEQGLVYENLNDKEKALDSYYDALLVNWENPELNKNLGNHYLSAGNLALAIIHWKRYLETSPHEGEYFLIQKQFQYFSRELRMKNLEKQIFSLSEEQTRDLYKIYRNMKVELGP